MHLQRCISRFCECAHNDTTKRKPIVRIESITKTKHRPVYPMPNDIEIGETFAS